MLSQISFPGKTSEGEEEAEEDEGDAQPVDDRGRLAGLGEGGGQVQISADGVLENWLGPDWNPLLPVKSESDIPNSMRHNPNYGYQQMTSWKIDWTQIEIPFPIANAAFWVKSESEIPWVE